MDKKNKNPNVPNLRFSFEEDWCTSTIGENFRLSSGLTPSTKEKAYFNNGIIPWINSVELKNKYISSTENKLTLDAVNKHNLTIYPMDTMVIAIYGLEAAGVRGKASITKMDSTISQSCMAFNSLGNVLTQFMYYVYKKEAQILGTRYAQGTKQQNLSSDLLSSYKLLYPSKEEQLKIVNFLSLIDEKIETQIKIIELKQSLIKDIEDKLLWKSASTYSRHISDFLTELNDKSKIQNQYPLLSSTKKGLFLQTDYFNKEAASSNNIGYKIVHEGDIIISPQNLWMGNITYNDKFVNGLVSPSYRIYKVKEEYNAYYISRILMSYRALSLYKNISEQGASIVRRNLNVDAFNELCFPIPNIKKQDEVSLFLSKLHQELNSEIEILRQLKNQKKYLLCNMFI